MEEGGALLLASPTPPTPPPDLRDVELKLGRKVPESLARSLLLRAEDEEQDEEEEEDGGRQRRRQRRRRDTTERQAQQQQQQQQGSPPGAGGGGGGGGAPGAAARPGTGGGALERLQAKLHLLRQEMVDLRATDVKLMRQLLIINESIESIKWMIEEKGGITSRGSSLSGSLCSLLESQDTSLRGSCNSLQDYSDGLDGISVGSYLDTLADDIPGQRTPSDMDQFSDSSLIDEPQSLHKHPKIESDEYYCFG